MGYVIAFIPVLVVAGISLWKMNKQSKEFIKYIKDYELEIRECNCVSRNICVDHGDSCKECSNYMSEAEMKQIIEEAPKKELITDYER